MRARPTFLSFVRNEMSIGHLLKANSELESHRRPTHYDCYGINLVAQLYGTKLWRLHPPLDPALSASRVPYEESSVYADEGPAAGVGPEDGEGPQVSVAIMRVRTKLKPCVILDSTRSPTKRAPYIPTGGRRPVWRTGMGRRYLLQY